MFNFSYSCGDCPYELLLDKTIISKVSAGPLPKSISFKNSKVPKVKQLVIEVPQKPKNLKEPISLITKQDGPVITLAKSTSVKKPNSSEPVSKGKSSILLDVEEPRMMNSVMSRNVTNKRGTSISGYPSVAASMLVPVPSKAESAAQHLNKQNKMDNLGIAYGKDGRNFPEVVLKYGGLDGHLSFVRACKDTYHVLLHKRFWK
uniref:Uncharacterized protein n=1 Tax=Aegilops tauschii subsp. strangulata TaxID=200361 RepID=A0A453LCR6_AEGTS